MATKSTGSSDASVEKAPAPTETDVSDRRGALSSVRPADPVEPLSSDADYVQYKGRATERRITEQQWKQARVNDQGEVVWNKGNGFRVPLSDLSDTAQQALARDGSFALPEKR